MTDADDGATADTPMFEILRAAIAAEEPVALATIVALDGEAPGLATGAKILIRPDHEPMGSLGNDDLDRVVIRDTRGELAAGTTGIRHYGPNGEARQEEVAVFVESFAPPPRMLIFGAVDFTAALSRVAKVLGYRVTVCDARPVFATTQRFPWADEVVVDWPHRLLDKIGPELTPRDAICVLTHDPKFDVPAVIAALKTDAGYLGAMGSRRTTDDRNRRLREEGVGDEQLAVSDAALEEMIRRYTREAGVRELERVLGRLARKVALRAAEGRL